VKLGHAFGEGCRLVRGEAFGVAVIQVFHFERASLLPLRQRMEIACVRLAGLADRVIGHGNVGRELEQFFLRGQLDERARKYLFLQVHALGRIVGLYVRVLVVAPFVT